MRQYHELLKCILRKGKPRKDRTGVLTHSIFGIQSRYNIAEGFELSSRNLAKATSFIDNKTSKKIERATIRLTPSTSDLEKAAKSEPNDFRIIENNLDQTNDIGINCRMGMYANKTIYINVDNATYKTVDFIPGFSRRSIGHIKILEVFLKKLET